MAKKPTEGEQLPPPPPPKGECPAGNTHQWVNDGHDMVCANCGLRVTQH